MTVRIHIDRLLLEGFTLTAGQARQVQASVERELSRLVSMPPAGNTGQEAQAEPLHGARSAMVPTATSGLFTPPPSASPTQLGRHIAQSIHGGVRSAK
jgi:hypothetical protein